MRKQSERKKIKMKIIHGNRARPMIDCLNSFLDGNDDALKEIIQITGISEKDLIKETT